MEFAFIDSTCKKKIIIIKKKIISWNISFKILLPKKIAYWIVLMFLVIYWFIRFSILAELKLKDRQKVKKNK